MSRNFPVALVAGTKIVSIHYGPEQFTGPDGVQHPVDCWSQWSDGDWAEKVPGWDCLPVTVGALPDPAVCTVTGSTSTIVKGIVVVEWTSAPLSDTEIATALALSKEQALAQVDITAEATRLRFITGGAGQAMAYQEKLAEAQAYQATVAAGKTPAASDYPHLAAEIGITAADMEGVASAIFAQAGAWRVMSAQIEGARMRGKAAVRAASTSAGVTAALADIEWPE